MPAKKNSRTKAISDSDILAMYEAIVPLLSDSPKGFELTSTLNKFLLTFVQYDFYHYVMDTPSHNPFQERLEMVFEKWVNLGSDSKASSVSMLPSAQKDSDAKFEEAVSRNYESALARRSATYPRIREYDYHRIESKTHPRIVLGFFRRKDIPTKGFTREEKNIFDELAPHLFSLYRAVLYQVYLSQGFQYFNSFSQIGSKIASDYHLSEAEVRLLPDILFGLNNEAIAEKNFIAVETVKSHIKHILKKTGTKNRIDFIGKFFTSPENVQL